MKIIMMMLVSLLVGCAAQPRDTLDGNNGFPFSLVELEQAEKGRLAPVQFISASDNTQLAYRAYVPKPVDAVLVLHHGATAHSGLGIYHLAEALSRNYNIAVYTPDVRGHGYSAGRRGDSPSTEQVWQDISVLVRHVKAVHPDKKLYLAGHSAGAGMLLNYSDYVGREAVAGYLFLSPYLGYRAALDTPSAAGFVRVKQELFAKNAMLGSEGNSYVVYFNLPAGELEKHPEMVDKITVNMAKARTPSAPARQLNKMQEPLVMWIGERDEAIDANKAAAYIQANKPDAATHIVEGENHLGILLSAADLIGPWLLQH